TGGATAGASGADGTFTLKGADPQGGVFGVTARKGNAITAAPVAVDPAKPDGEIRGVIAEKFAARLRVRAGDRAGRPVEGGGGGGGRGTGPLGDVPPPRGRGPRLGGRLQGRRDPRRRPVRVRRSPARRPVRAHPLRAGLPDRDDTRPGRRAGGDARLRRRDP